MSKRLSLGICLTAGILSAQTSSSITESSTSFVGSLELKLFFGLCFGGRNISSFPAVSQCSFTKISLDFWADCDPERTQIEHFEARCF